MIHFIAIICRLYSKILLHGMLVLLRIDCYYSHYTAYFTDNAE